MNKQSLWFYIPFFTVITILVVSIIAITSFDLSISQNLYTGQTLFVRIFEAIGKAPAFILLAVCLSILYRSVKMHDNMNAKVLSWVYGIAIFVSCILLVFETTSLVTDKIIRYALVIAFGGALGGASIMLANTINPQKCKRFEKWAFISCAAIGIIIVFALFFKFAWGRFRYSEILTNNGVFTDWYKPQGFTGGDSMPSGHAAISTTLLLPLLLLKQYPKKMWQNILIILSVCCFISLCAVSRIMGGYHFATDTIISILFSTITIGITLICFTGTRLDKTTFVSQNVLCRVLNLGEQKEDLD